MKYLKEKIFLKIFGTFKVPLISWVKPKIIKLDDEESIISIPLIRRTSNHLGSMYFGVLATGADLAGGFLAYKYIKDSGKSIHLSFKDFKADFLKRATAETYFINNQGKEIREFVRKVGENPNVRMNFPLIIQAKCPSLSEDIIANFELTLSLKYKVTQ